jgi:hypothetical protein
MPTTREKLRVFLTANGWKEFKTFAPIWPEVMHEGWSKKLFGDVYLVLNYTALTIHGNLSQIVSVDIKLEVNGIWYNLQAYSISPEGFMERHVEIVNKLISLRNTLCL